VTAPEPLDCFKAAIARWEGLYSDNPNDSGNYTPAGKLVGTMRGVTVDAYAQYDGRDPEEITPEELQQAVTPDVAAAIYDRKYYRGPGFDRLPWSPLVEAAADFGWGSGPGRAIEYLQRLVGAAPDGIIGPVTIATAKSYMAREGLAPAVDAFAKLRSAFYITISRPGTPNAQFRKGWLSRAAWYTTGNRAWWQELWGSPA
jgi:lysozyme family protein